MRSPIIEHSGMFMAPTLSEVELTLGIVEFIKLVSDMRRAQRAYYAERPRSAEKQKYLIEAKRLEGLVDMRLAELKISKK